MASQAGTSDGVSSAPVERVAAHEVPVAPPMPKKRMIDQLVRKGGIRGIRGVGEGKREGKSGYEYIV